MIEDIFRVLLNAFPRREGYFYTRRRQHVYFEGTFRPEELRAEHLREIGTDRRQLVKWLNANLDQPEGGLVLIKRNFHSLYRVIREAEWRDCPFTAFQLACRREDRAAGVWNWIL